MAGFSGAAGGRAVGLTVLFIVGFVLTAGLLIPILAVFGQSKDLQAHGVRR